MTAAAGAPARDEPAVALARETITLLGEADALLGDVAARLRYIAARLEAAAERADYKLAGWPAGNPVAYQLIDATRRIAAAARGEAVTP
jgi:thioesterase domain-containing protein